MNNDQYILKLNKLLNETRTALKALLDASSATHAGVSSGHFGVTCPECTLCETAISIGYAVLAKEITEVYKPNDCTCRVVPRVQASPVCPIHGVK
jgi:hypothetical protein